MASLSTNAVTVLERRYLTKDSDGNITETPDEMFKRVASAIAGNEHNYVKYADAFYEEMASLRFLPNSPTLANAGRPLGQLSACFVLPVDDSVQAIMSTAQNMALIHKSGGGTGFSFGKIRPRGSLVRSTAGIASGPVPFIELFDRVSETVKQGSMRHGANMGILPYTHPDIKEFIHIKDGGNKLQNFNISVAVDSDFMTGQRNGGLWEEIVQSAWQTGDPGLIFIDRINASTSNPVPARGPIEATNPCGEQPLYPYDSCNLGSVNLTQFVDGGGVNWTKLDQTVRLAVRFLDDVIDVNQYPLPQIEAVAKNIRRIGLGVMGWADALYLMGIRYDSHEALEIGADIAAFIETTADAESILLAKEKGRFYDWPQSIYAQSRDKVEYRNCTRTTIAPTGTISIIAGCSSGIEPVFALEIQRKHNLDKADPNAKTEMTERNPVYQRWLEQFAGEPEPDYFVTAQDIAYDWHIRHQAVWQRHVDNAVSKTINMQNEAKPEDVAKAYQMAWELDCKGITIYRDGSKTNQVLSVKETKPDASPIVINTDSQPRHRLPNTRNGTIHKFYVNGHEGYLHTGLYENGRLGEIFVTGDREGSTISGLVDAVCIATSIGLQHGVPLGTFVRKYVGTKFEPSGMTKNPDIPRCTSVLDYIFRWLDQQYGSEQIPLLSGDLCPDCGSSLERAEGCEKCQSCGYSAC